MIVTKQTKEHTNMKQAGSVADRVVFMDWATLIRMAIL